MTAHSLDLDAALARAAETVRLLRGDEDEGLLLSGRNLAGWARAVKALEEAHFCTYPEHQDASRHPRCDQCRVIVDFVAAFPPNAEQTGTEEARRQSRPDDVT